MLLLTKMFGDQQSCPVPMRGMRQDPMIISEIGPMFSFLGRNTKKWQEIQEKMSYSVIFPYIPNISYPHSVSGTRVEAALPKHQ